MVYILWFSAKCDAVAPETLRGKEVEMYQIFLYSTFFFFFFLIGTGISWPSYIRQNALVCAYNIITRLFCMTFIHIVNWLHNDIIRSTFSQFVTHTVDNRMVSVSSRRIHTHTHTHMSVTIFTVYNVMNIQTTNIYNTCRIPG